MGLMHFPLIFREAGNQNKNSFIFVWNFHRAKCSVMTLSNRWKIEKCSCEENMWTFRKVPLGCKNYSFSSTFCQVQRFYVEPWTPGKQDRPSTGLQVLSIPKAWEFLMGAGRGECMAEPAGVNGMELWKNRQGQPDIAASPQCCPLPQAKEKRAWGKMGTMHLTKLLAQRNY